MNWIKNNISALLLLGVVLLFVGTGVNKLVQEKNIEEITIVSGDTLWSLAKEYSGDMDPQKWILQVKESNAIVGDNIVAGKTISIPNKVDQSNQMEIASDR